MSSEELALLNEFFTSQFGLYFPEHKREILESRLLPRMRANRVHRFLDYYLLLQYDADKELDFLTQAITNNESYFFREISQFKALDHARIEELQEGGHSRGLRLLSAGCSSGEEPYTLNIFLRGLPNLRHDLLRIDAMDLDSGRLSVARRATYRSGSLRTLSQGQITKYFVKHDMESFELRSAHREGISFHSGNIVNISTYPSRSGYDAIFCRNVLIYFSESAIQAAIDAFAKVMRPGGLLFLGHSESIIGLTNSFQAERLGQCIAYRRTEG
jgi:chemotaxis protein methyltransferase CheR